MKPILNNNELDVILTSEIKDDHYVVCYYKGEPCIVATADELDMYTLVCLEEGYLYAADGAPMMKKRDLVEWMLKNNMDVAVYEYWKDALTWLMEYNQRTA